MITYGVCVAQARAVLIRMVRRLGQDDRRNGFPLPGEAADCTCFASGLEHANVTVERMVGSTPHQCDALRCSLWRKARALSSRNPRRVGKLW